MKVVAERLGHGSVGITMGIYAHTQVGMDAEAADIMGDLVRGRTRLQNGDTCRIPAPEDDADVEV